MTDFTLLKGRILRRLGRQRDPSGASAWTYHGFSLILDHENWDVDGQVVLVQMVDKLGKMQTRRFQARELSLIQRGELGNCYHGCYWSVL